MKRIKLTLALIAFISFSIMLSSCKKNADIQTENTTVSQDNSFVEGIYENVSDIADEAYDFSTNNLKSTDGWRHFLSDCVTVTLDTTAFPRQLTIDFGEVNCLCNDGRYRRGMIIVTWTGRYCEFGTVISHSFENFYVNDNHVEGSKVVTNMGLNNNGNVYFTIVINGTVTMADNTGVITWNSSRQRELIQGYDTPGRWDNIYLVTGTASGTRLDGVSWLSEILNPLRVEMACRFIVSGTVQITPDNLPSRILDYGDGNCDNIATVTINGVTYTIHLR
jgi:outer membrane murein-binding lipoprotein Lpp